MRIHNAKRFAIALALFTMTVGAQSPGRAQSSGAIGIFDGHGDVGSVLHAGSSEYDSAVHTYTLAGSGENMWSNSDNFQFAWKKVSGDLALSAAIAILGQGGNEHRKAVLMIRQDLEVDSAYADVALHGDGLTSLQYRDAKGAATHEIQSNISAPSQLRIEKRGEYVYLWLAAQGEKIRPAGAAMRVSLQGPVLRGIGSLQPRQGFHNQGNILQGRTETARARLGRGPADAAQLP